MDAIINSLGVNSTLWIQMLLFAVCFAVLYFLIFRPYMSVFDEREKRTVGSEESAEKALEEAKNLQKIYEEEAHAMSSKMKVFFDKAHMEGKEEATELFSRSQKEADRITQEGRKKLKEEVLSARSQIKVEVANLSQCVVDKLSGRA